MRQPLKIILFPVHRLGELISGEWVHLLHIFEIFLFFSAFSIYNVKYIFKQKKDFAASRLAIIMGTRWTGNNLFLRMAYGTDKDGGYMAGESHFGSKMQNGIFYPIFFIHFHLNMYHNFQ